MRYIFLPSVSTHTPTHALTHPLTRFTLRQQAQAGKGAQQVNNTITTAMKWSPPSTGRHRRRFFAQYSPLGLAGLRFLSCVAERTTDYTRRVPLLNLRIGLLPSVVEVTVPPPPFGRRQQRSNLNNSFPSRRAAALVAARKRAQNYQVSRRLGNRRIGERNSTRRGV